MSALQAWYFYATLFAVGVAYTIGMTVAAYMAIKYRLPLFGAPPPESPPMPTRKSFDDIRERE